MSWYNIFKILIAVFGSVGGAGIIIIGLSSWLGKIWANRILEKEKKEHQKDIEKYKSQLEELRTNSLRYLGKQFDLYTQLWRSLCDLESIADVLWEKVKGENLEQFVSNLKKTKKEVKESRLFIEDSHYKRLLELFNKFENYQIGKTKLLNIQLPVKKREISFLVLKNSKNRDDYKKLMEEVSESLKKQLRGIK